MIIDTKVGDITSPINKDDIVIAMNSTFAEPSALGRPFVKGKVLAGGPLDLGSVVTYDFNDRGRMLHMVICHTMDERGWETSPLFLRWGLDYLWNQYQVREGRKFSVVNIGKGDIGQRMNAPYPALKRAMVDSHLEMTLWIYGGLQSQAVCNVVPLRPLRAWTRDSGMRDIQEIRFAA